MLDPVRLRNAVLLLIDLQHAIDHPDWGVRNNMQAEENIQTLLAAWRERAWPVWHVRHDSVDPASPYRPGQPGHDFKADTGPNPGETVIAKQTNSAFIGTGLEVKLREAGHTTLVVVGVITNNSVEATVRMAGNLGFETVLAADGCYTFGRTDWNGVFRDAEAVHALSLANMDGEYCTVGTTAEILAAVPETRET